MQPVPSQQLFSLAWQLPLALVSLGFLAAVCGGVIPRGRLLSAPPREAPRWSGPHLILIFLFYFLLPLPVGHAVEAVAETGYLSPAGERFLGLLLWNGAVCLMILLVVRRFHDRPWRALGLVESSLGNLIPVTLLVIFSYFPLVVVYTTFRLTFWLVTGSFPPEQEPVVEFRDVARQGDALELFYLFLSSSLVAPVCEEIIYRGFLFGQLRCRWGFPAALSISSLVFAAPHGPGALPIFCVGALIAYVYERTGSLYYCVFFHILFNSSQLLMMLCFAD